MSQFKPVTGSFLDGIACDIPSNNWGPQDWRKQFDNMKAIGMDTVIIIRVGWGDSAMYDSPTLQTTPFSRGRPRGAVLRRSRPRGSPPLPWNA